MNRSDEEFLFRCALATTVFALILPGWREVLFLGLVNNVLIWLVGALQIALSLILSKRQSQTAYFLLTGAGATVAVLFLEAFFFEMANPLGSFLPLLFVNTLLLTEEIPFMRKIFLGLWMWGGGFLIAVVRSLWIPETWGMIAPSAFLLVGLAVALGAFRTLPRGTR